VRGADPGAGEHRDHGLGDHRHVDRDPVAGLDAELEQRVGRLAHLVLELGVGDLAGVAGLTFEVVRDLVAEAVLDVPVDAVVGRVQLAVGVPLGERRIAPVQRLGRLDRPGQPLGLLGPEPLEIGGGPFVGVGLEVGVRGQVGGWLEPALLVHQVRQGLRLCAFGLG
jgi:hypothetical protein